MYPINASTTTTTDLANNSFPILQPTTYFQCEIGGEEWEKCVPNLVLSSPSRMRFTKWMQGVKVYLTKAQLQLCDNEIMQSWLQEQLKAWSTSWWSLNSGGPLNVEEAREKQAAKREKETDEAIRKAQKAITKAVNKAKKALNQQGIKARKLERERRQLVQELQARNEFIDVDLLDPIPNPEKNLTTEDLESLQLHPSLVQVLVELQVPIDPQLLIDDSSKVQFKLTKAEDIVDVVQGESCDSDMNEIARDYKSESEESQGSLDSIARNADFISLF